MIGIIDYDAGNIRSVEKALSYLGEKTVVSRDPDILKSVDKVILPGVGSFGRIFARNQHYASCILGCFYKNEYNYVRLNPQDSIAARR